MCRSPLVTFALLGNPSVCERSGKLLVLLLLVLLLCRADVLFLITSSMISFPVVWLISCKYWRCGRVRCHQYVPPDLPPPPTSGTNAVILSEPLYDLHKKVAAMSTTGRDIFPLVMDCTSFDGSRTCNQQVNYLVIVDPAGKFIALYKLIFQS